MAERWMPGRKVGRTLYIHEDAAETGRLVGLVDTPEIAAAICAAMNDQRTSGAYEPLADRDVPDELVAMLSGGELHETAARVVLRQLLAAYRRILFADVPDELVDAIATVLNDDAHEGCGDEPCPGNVAPYFADVVRVAAAEGLAERDRRVRAQVADEIEGARTEITGDWTRTRALRDGLARAARIARGEQP